MNAVPRWIVAAAGLLGFSGVALGAFGAHALKATLLANGTLATWQTAVLYQLVHAVALLALAGFYTNAMAHRPSPAAIPKASHSERSEESTRSPGTSRSLPWILHFVQNDSLGRIASCWLGGVVLFSGSLYLLALGGPKWLGPVTPLGGLAFLTGWLLLTWSALKKDSSA